MALQDKPVNLNNSALLLDVDGTILDIAATPSLVSVPPGLRGTLETLRDRTGGAVAFVSGRTLSQLDGIFSPLIMPAVAGHGAQLRVNGIEPRPRFNVTLDDHLRRQFADFAAKHDGVMLEDKGFSLALHYRLAPQHADAVREAVAAACAVYSDDEIEILPGKAVIEVKPAAFNKGKGVRELMAYSPFRGRRPIFLGDDVTDDSAFAVLPEFDGVGYSVGRKISGLAGTFHAPSDVREWLELIATGDGSRPQ